MIGLKNVSCDYHWFSNDIEFSTKYLVSRNDWAVQCHGEMNPWIGNQVGLKFIQVNVEGSIKPQRGGNWGDDLGNQPVQVGVGGSVHCQIEFAQFIDGLVVNQESNFTMLKCGVGVQYGIVGLNNSWRNLQEPNMSWMNTDFSGKNSPAVLDRWKSLAWISCHIQWRVVPWAGIQSLIRYLPQRSGKGWSLGAQCSFQPICALYQRCLRSSLCLECSDPEHNYWLHLLCQCKVDQDGTVACRYLCVLHLWI